MALGPFSFALSTQLLETLTDRETARFAQMDRAQTMPTQQFLGPGQRTIELNATIYKEVLSPDGPLQIELMRLWMRTGRRMPLIARSGHFYGFFVMTELTAEKAHVLPNGTFQKMSITIALTRAPSGFSVFGIPLF